MLLGDSAHAITPFFGQGTNASFEDCLVLFELMQEHAPANNMTTAGLSRAFDAFSRERKPNADAIAEMALDNYDEMRAGVIDPDHVARRSLALELERRHPNHLSPRYNMVMFTTMPYAEALDRATRQAAVISAAMRDPEIDIDALVAALPQLPALDPLADPNALSVS